MSEVLLPCPFCGGEAELLDEFDEYREKWGGEFDDSGLALGTSYKAVCCPAIKGGCGAIGGWQPTEAEAVAAWNTRSAGTCHSIDPVDSGEFFICSNCNFGAGRIEFIPNYCPSCGYKVVKNDDNR